MAYVLAPISVSVSLSEITHNDDDTIGGRIRLVAAEGAGGRSKTLIETTVTSAFWDDASVADYDRLLIGAPIEDVDALVVALFEMLGVQVREYGVDHVGCCYPDFRDFLAAHLPPAVAARLDAALCLALPPSRSGDTITFSI
jgi:hypothetical protein